MTRRSKGHRQPAGAAGWSLPGTRPPDSAPVGQTPAEADPAHQIWIPGPAYVQPLGDLARAVQHRRGGDALAAVSGAYVALDDLAARAVRLARAEGRTWTEVGEAFGVSKQAAHARWGSAKGKGSVSPSPRCNFSGNRAGCVHYAEVMRGTVPLCEPCEAASSSLKRLPLGRLPRTVAGST